MRIAILDPAAGISGDMTLGALLSLGVPSAWLEGLPSRLGLAGVGVAVRDVVRCGVGCKQVEFMIPEQPHGRHVGELVRLVERAPVSEWVRARAVRAFQLLGEALVRVLARGATPERWRLVKSGWGAGQRNPGHHPNALRVLVAEQAAEAGRVMLVATDLDDMSPEYVEPLRQALVAAGALDVQTWPVQMKKGRSGFRVEVVAPEALGEAVTAALFRHSTTAGVRRWVAERATLAPGQGTPELAPRGVRYQAGAPAGEQRDAVAQERVLHQVRGPEDQGSQGRGALAHPGGDQRQAGEESGRVVLPGSLLPDGA